MLFNSEIASRFEDWHQTKLQTVLWHTSHKDHNHMIHNLIGNIDNGSYWGDFYNREQLPADMSSTVAASESHPYWKIGRLIAGCDASWEHGCAAFGLVPIGHVCSGGAILSPHPIPDSTYAEVVGIGAALDTARAILSTTDNYREVFILCDNASAIRSILGLDSSPTADERRAILVDEVRLKLETTGDTTPTTPLPPR